MASRRDILTTLPAELISAIATYLPFPDRKTLSSTNAHLRGVLLAKLFRSIRFSNLGEKDYRFPLRNPNNIHGLVRTLVFECHLTPFQSNRGGRFRDKCDLEPRVFDLLYYPLRYFRHINCTVIKFSPVEDFNVGIWDNGMGSSIYIVDEAEDEFDTVFAEHAFPWRGVVALTFASLMRNPRIRKLELYNVVPLPCSMFRTQPWKEFLRGLDDFEISIWGGEDECGIKANTRPGYVRFFASLNDFFFNHLQRARRVRFAAHEDNLAGEDDDIHLPLGLNAKAMSMLEDLTLEHCYIDTTVVNLIRERKDALRRIELRDCLSAATSPVISDKSRTIEAPTPITWATLFRAIYESQGSLLHLGYIDSKIAVALTDPSVSDLADEENDNANIEAIRKAVLSGKRKLFGYGRNDFSGEPLRFDEYLEINLDMYAFGHDQVEWDKCTEMVAKNQAERSRA